LLLTQEVVNAAAYWHSWMLQTSTEISTQYVDIFGGARYNNNSNRLFDVGA